MEYLCIFFAVVAFFQLVVRYHRSQLLKELSERSTSGFDQLKQQLTNRHVIVSHLADSLPSSFDPKFERQRLREISHTAEDSLSSIDPRRPSADHVREFMFRERELLDATRELVDNIASDSEVNQAHLVASCIECLDRANAKIGDLTSIYNTSANAYQNSRSVSFLRQRNRHQDLTVFDMEDWRATRS